MYIAWQAKSRDPRYVNVHYGAMHTDGVIKANGSSYQYATAS